MTYVDLNPVRARMADTPETSDHTSVKKRVAAARKEKTQPTTLHRFVGNPREPMPEDLPFFLEGYLQLVDWTRRSIREDKRGAIDDRLPCILTRLNFDAGTWRKRAVQFSSKVSMLVGSQKAIGKQAQSFGYQREPSRTMGERPSFLAQKKLHANRP